METEITEKKQNDKPWLFKPGQSGNPLGRPKDSISLVTDIKNRLIYIKEHQPEKYQSIIDDYWMDKSKRELLIKIVEPHAFGPQVAIQNNVIVNPTREQVVEDVISFCKQASESEWQQIQEARG